MSALIYLLMPIQNMYIQSIKGFGKIILFEKYRVKVPWVYVVLKILDEPKNFPTYTTAHILM